MNWFTPVQRTELLQSSRDQLPIHGSRWWAGLGGPPYHGMPWTTTQLDRLSMWFQLPTRLWSHPSNWVRLSINGNLPVAYGIIYYWSFCFILENGRYKQYDSSCVLPPHAPRSFFFMPSTLPQTLIRQPLYDHNLLSCLPTKFVLPFHRGLQPLPLPFCLFLACLPNTCTLDSAFHHFSHILACVVDASPIILWLQVPSETLILG